jgi:DNA repair protein RecN (Recombination protein N)
VETIAVGRHALAGEVDHDPRLLELDRRLADLGYLAADLASDLSAYASDIDIDPARLGWVQQRRADLATLTRKYGDTVDDALAWGRDAAARLDRLVGSDSRVEELAAEVHQLRTDLGRAAGEVTAELAHLAMGQAVVEVAVSQRTVDPAGAAAPGADPEQAPSVDPRPPGGLEVPGLGASLRFGRHGVDDVEIRLAANPGSPVRSVARAASGGELSRVMLALEVVTGRAGSAEVPTFVFDEVDAGVGGAAALAVGARLAALACHAQVVVVTHLPQVAAYADRHLVVRKASDGHITASGVHALEGDERLRELARMMAGVDTDAALDHARELVAEAASRRSAAPSR